MSDEPTTDFGLGAPEPIGESAPESAPAEPARQPTIQPDIGEAVHQMRESIQRLEQRIPEPEPGPYGDSDYGYDPDDLYDLDPDDPAAIAQQAAQQAAAEVRGELQQQQDMDTILAFAEKHPTLAQPEILEQVVDRLRALGLSETDPEAVATAFYAVSAMTAMNAAPGQAGEEPAEQPQRPGVHLETNAGSRPGGGSPGPQQDPVERAYHEALGGNIPPANKFGL